MRPKWGGHPIHSTTCVTSNPPCEGSLRNGASSIKYCPNIAHHKQTSYVLWRGRSRYQLFIDIILIFYSKIQCSGQDPNSRRCKNRIHQRACSGSVVIKSKHCHKRGINHEDSPHPVILYLLWNIEAKHCCFQISR